MTPDGYSYYQRKFLNRPGYHAGAYVLATVEGSCGYLTIADGRRLITLDFYVSTPENRRNSLHKVDALIDTLTAMRAALAQNRGSRRAL